MAINATTGEFLWLSTLKGTTSIWALFQKCALKCIWPRIIECTCGPTY